jgi:hypothetical protein
VLLRLRKLRRSPCASPSLSSPQQTELSCLLRHRRVRGLCPCRCRRNPLSTPSLSPCLQALLDAGDRGRGSAEESLALYKASVAKLQEKLEGSVAEIHRGNAIIGRLQVRQRGGDGSSREQGGGGGAPHLAVPLWASYPPAPAPAPAPAPLPASRTSTVQSSPACAARRTLPRPPRLSLQRRSAL